MVGVGELGDGYPGLALWAPGWPPPCCPDRGDWSCSGLATGHHSQLSVALVTLTVVLGHGLWEGFIVWIGVAGGCLGLAIGHRGNQPSCAISTSVAADTTAATDGNTQCCPTITGSGFLGLLLGMFGFHRCLSSRSTYLVSPSCGIDKY